MAASNNGLLPIETPSYPGLNLSDNQGPRIIAASIALMVITTIAVVLRFVARLLSRAGLWWDDWCAMAAMVTSWGCCVCMILAVGRGLGKHAAAQGTPLQDIIALSEWLKIFFGYETIYTVGVTLTKYSILLFYSRIFQERSFKIALWVTFAAVTAWFIATELVVIFSCTPIASLWDFTLAGHCIDITKLFLACGIPNVILNVVILILPLPMIWTLQIERKYKIALSSVFMLGGFVVIVSIIRLVILAATPQVDVTWTFVNGAIWTSVEPSIGVCSACLPILRSLWIWRRPHHSLHASASMPATGKTFRETPDLNRASSYNSHIPLNELSAENELPWGTRVQLQTARKFKGRSGNEIGEIQMRELTTQRSSIPATVPSIPRPALRQSSSISGNKPLAELYG